MIEQVVDLVVGPQEDQIFLLSEHVDAILQVVRYHLFVFLHSERSIQI
jgi:hypothetical protein